MSQPGLPSTPPPALRTLRLVVASMASALLVIALAWVFVVPFSAPTLDAVVAVLLVGVVAAVLLARQGRRVAPLPAGMPAEEAYRRATTVFQSALLLRVALSELPAFVAIALSVALRPGSWWTLALGVAVGLVLIAVFAWPTVGRLDALVTTLESQGTPSGLRETFGLPSTTPYDAPQAGPQAGPQDGPRDGPGGGYLPL